MAVSSSRPAPPPPEPLAPLIDAHTHLDACGAKTADTVRAICDRAAAVGVHECLVQRTPVSALRPAAKADMPAAQQHILNHLIQGRSDKEIAYHLKLSEHTVDYHMRQLRKRFAARNRVQLVNAAIEAAVPA